MVLNRDGPVWRWDAGVIAAEEWPIRNPTADARVRSANVFGMESAVNVLPVLILIVLAVVGLLLLVGLIALIVSLMRRTQKSANPTVANETPLHLNE